MRIDKWLWAARVYKTRSLAAEACRAGHVKIKGQSVKAAREVRLGEVIVAQAGLVTRTIKVMGLVQRRVGPKEVSLHLEDLTPPDELNKGRLRGLAPVRWRPKGQGRPTKKDRRALGRISDNPEHY